MGAANSSVLIVGLGQIGMGYDLSLDPAEFAYSHARAFTQHPRFALLGGVDTDASRRMIFTRTFGRPAYDKLADALYEHDPQVVVLAVPTELHGETLRQVLAHVTPKAVLCEKPLAYQVDEAEDLVRTCAERGVLLYVNYMRRSDCGVVEVKARLDRGEIGTPVKGVVWYSKGFLHNGSHFFNLLEYWLGAAQEGQVLTRGRTLGTTDAEPDVAVKFPLGSVVFLAAREECFSHYTVELLGPTGRLRYEQGGRQIEWQTVTQDENLRSYRVLNTPPDSIASGMKRYQWHVADQLAHALEGREPQLCSGADALRTLTTMRRIIDRGSL